MQCWKMFDEDFTFKMTKEELVDLRSKNLTANISPKSRALPNVYTEQGIYMLMTVLDGELAAAQSKALIRTFKAMKDYIVENNEYRWSFDNVITMDDLFI